jgi:hypothetical protein
VKVNTLVVLARHSVRKSSNLADSVSLQQHLHFFLPTSIFKPIGNLNQP